MQERRVEVSDDVATSTSLPFRHVVLALAPKPWLLLLLLTSCLAYLRRAGAPLLHVDVGMIMRRGGVQASFRFCGLPQAMDMDIGGVRLIRQDLGGVLYSRK